MESCERCGRDVEFHSNKEFIKRISDDYKSPPDNKEEILCIDCSLKLMEDAKDEYNFPSVEWMFVCKLIEYKLPVTRSNIEWYKECIEDFRKNRRN